MTDNAKRNVADVNEDVMIGLIKISWECVSLDGSRHLPCYSSPNAK